MCGRYVLKTSTPELAAILGADEPGAAFEPRYNIAPSSQVPLVRHAEALEFFSARWGLVPFWSKDGKSNYSMINARAETVATKPAFRKAYQQRRCLVPADAYYEWQRRDAVKQPYLIARQDGAPMWFAGLWELWRPQARPTNDTAGTRGDVQAVVSFTIVTTAANSDVSEVHDRMPVIVEQPHLQRWLRGSPAQAGALLRPAAAGLLTSVPVSTYVNNARNEGPRCATPLTAI